MIEINWNAQWGGKNIIFDNCQKRSYLFLKMNSSIQFCITSIINRSLKIINRAWFNCLILLVSESVGTFIV